MSEIKLLAFSGSLRRESTNTKVLKIATAGAKEAGASVETLDLKQLGLPLYDGDIETESGVPEAAKKAQAKMREADGFLIASPEYNSSLSGALKNFIDWTSRPDGDHAAGASFGGKVAVLMSASPGGLGGLRGLFDIRKILETMGVIVLPDQVAVQKCFEAFADDGTLADPNLQKAVQGLGSKLAEFSAQLKK